MIFLKYSFICFYPGVKLFKPNESAGTRGRPFSQTMRQKPQTAKYKTDAKVCLKTSDLFKICPLCPNSLRKLYLANFSGTDLDQKYNPVSKKNVHTDGVDDDDELMLNVLRCHLTY